MIGPFGLQPKATLSFRALPIAQALVARGHSVTLLIPPWDHPADAGREWQEVGVRVLNVSLPPRLPLVFQAWLALRLVRHALALRPDVVHCFKPKAYAGLAHFVLWWLRRLGLARGKLSRSVRLVVDEDDWEQAWNAGQGYPPLYKRVFAWQEKWGLTHAEAVTVASRALEALVQELGVPPDRIFYVPNGLGPMPADKSGLERSPAGDAQTVRMLWELDDALVVLLYTRFVEFRLERVVDILHRVVTAEPRAKLLVIGEGLFGEESDLDDMLEAAGLSDHVVFTGWVESGRLPSYFAASDVAIFPLDDTLINRTKCSVKLIDLLANGLPVVADAVGQATEYILDRQSGWLVEPEDDEAFADAVLRLLADPELRAQLGAAAARRVQERFRWDKLVEEVERAYR
ncbi:MAG: glycosyltransferase family 4 protein [Anaerolineae bacterium]